MAQYLPILLRLPPAARPEFLRSKQGRTHHFA
jgi:hypothetical protein